MGMFDDIIVPKSYLKGLLTKEQEKLIKDKKSECSCSGDIKENTNGKEKAQRV